MNESLTCNLDETSPDDETTKRKLLKTILAGLLIFLLLVGYLGLMRH